MKTGSSTADGAGVGGVSAWLAARCIKSNVGKYETRKWPYLADTDRHYPPNWPGSWDKSHKYDFMSIDGGLIDNEPFEYARRAIMRDNEDNKTGENSVKGAVVMVDPPEPPAFSLKEIDQASIFDVARAVLPMLKNQARFKPGTLATAFDNTNYSRWMIAPSRPEGSHGTEERALRHRDGRVGRLRRLPRRSFRAHDYQLGRRNCQRFLQTVFSVGEGHPFVKDWPSGVAERFRRYDDDTKKFYYPVIARRRTAALQVPAPTAAYRPVAPGGDRKAHQAAGRLRRPSSSRAGRGTSPEPAGAGAMAVAGKQRL